MGWEEVVKVNSDLTKPLNVLIDELRQRVGVVTSKRKLCFYGDTVHYASGQTVTLVNLTGRGVFKHFCVAVSLSANPLLATNTTNPYKTPLITVVRDGITICSDAVATASTGNSISNGFTHGGMAHLGYFPYGNNPLNPFGLYHHGRVVNESDGQSYHSEFLTIPDGRPSALWFQPPSLELMYTESLKISAKFEVWPDATTDQIFRWGLVADQEI